MTRSCAPGRSFVPWSLRAIAFCKMSVTSVLFPLPETPVTAMNRPSGNSTSSPFRLCSRAPFTTMLFPLPFRRVVGIFTARSPRMNAPVMESFESVSALSVPFTTTFPPSSPAPGPMSTIQSAVRIVSSSCSTTSTVFPRSRSRSSVVIRRALSRWCNPIDGSSRM